jgi:ATP-dependent Lhr-like helicase
VNNAATVISALHRGEKRLVFADSRRTVESLATGLRERQTETFVSHSSLSVDERRRAETAFSEARDCVIVSTSTLELGIDVGDLDRVVQVGAPGTVASVLQRLGRTGRRPGTSRSLLFLATNEDEFLRAAGLLLLWGEGFVEPVTPPPAPRHVLAQQLIALCLQEGRVGESTWQSWLFGLPLASAVEAEAVTQWLVESAHLDVDGGMLFVGPQAERRYGNRNFMELLSVFTTDPQFLILHGRNEIGAVDPMVLTRKVEGPRLISLAGRSWEVTYIDWKRRRAFVEPSKHTGISRWSGVAQPLSFALTDAMRRVVLGAELGGVSLTRRGTDRLAAIRDDLEPTVSEAGTVVSAWDKSQMRWWTWAGARANGVLSAAITQVQPGIIDERDRYDNRYIALRGDATAVGLSSALRVARERFGEDLSGVEPSVSAEAVKQLKFAELLPPDLAAATLAARAADHGGARAIANRAVVTQ